jgi:hypothetical protein
MSDIAALRPRLRPPPPSQVAVQVLITVEESNFKMVSGRYYRLPTTVRMLNLIIIIRCQYMRVQVSNEINEIEF